MVKKTKTSKTKSTKTSTTTSTPVVEETVAAATPAVTATTSAKTTKKSSKKLSSKKSSTKTTKKASSKKSTSTKKSSSKSSKSSTVQSNTATTTVPDTTTTTTTTTAASPPEPVDPFFESMSRVTQAYTTLLAELEVQREGLRKVTSEVKRQQKMVLKEMRDLQKHSNRGKKRNKSTTKRKPSGFAKPGKISDVLCEFLGKPVGTEMARTTVTTFLTDYIKKNNLQNPKNKKEILRDDKLSTIISVEPGDTLTYFNLQKYMKPHYLSSKSSQKVATA